jgi:hypothetical protein
MKTYNLQISPLLRIMPFVMLGVFTCGVPVLILMTNGPAFLLLPLFAVVAWNWWVLFRIAYRVVIQDDGGIEWLALARRVKLLPEDVREISPDRTGTIGFFTVTYVGGKVRFINQITGFHEVILYIKSRNPTVVIKGC